jgi:subtilisin family serine protease
MAIAGADASTVDVDVYGTISDSLLAEIAAAGGSIVYASERWGTVRAALPLTAVSQVAKHSDVVRIRRAARAFLHAGALTSQGYVTHAANQAVSLGVDGTGVVVGVLSDSALPARVAALIASGDLPADTTVLPGQQGPSNGSNEGAAMMEIVHDIAPGARLIFATAFTSPASFADNIIALQAAGATVIVDDVTWSSEGAFQDSSIAQAVNEVTGGGVVYLSSAGNFGNVTNGTSGTWEGDYRDSSSFHNFGTDATPQIYDQLIATTTFISLKWSDPLGASDNDYDLFILDSTGTTLKAFSIDPQTGHEDPEEDIVRGTNCGTASASGWCPAFGDRIIVSLFSGGARALRVDTFGGGLSIGTSGATSGHNAGLNTVSTAATYWNSARTGTRPFVGFANPTEVFSSDGPRKIFYRPDGSPITPGNLLFATNGGQTLQKPDLTAADGVSTKTPGFLPFFGTSAAAPHAAGIAALIRSVQPGWTPAQVVNAMKATALDAMAPGVDRDAGAGIAMALPAVQYAQIH